MGLWGECPVAFFRKGTVESVSPIDAGLSLAKVIFNDGEPEPALVLEDLVGAVKSGDDVICNTTAVGLELGSGGKHFVLWNLSRERLEEPSGGHIMKLRYTPLQFDCVAVSEQLSSHHEIMESVGEGLEGIPVIAGSVHSQLAPALVAFKSRWPEGRVVFVMTDGGSLPLKISDTVRFFKRSGHLAGTVSCGHAFGGDLEAVDMFEGLVAARRVLKADAVIVTMGPGIVGTGTALGFTGIEQGIVVNSASSLGGIPIAIPRITFNDPRPRHKGLSHQTVSSLAIAANIKANIPLPSMEEEKRNLVMEQVKRAGLDKLHNIREIDASCTLSELREARWSPTVMGRTVEEEPEYFMAAGAAGIWAAEIGKVKK